MRVARQRLEVADAVVAGAGLEEAAEGEGGQGGEAAGARAADRDPLGIDVAALDQEARGSDDVVDIGDAPAAVEQLAVGAAVAAAAGVVDVDDREAPGGPELPLQRERRMGRARRAAVADDEQRRPLARRAGPGTVCRRSPIAVPRMPVSTMAAMPATMCHPLNLPTIQA